MVRGEVLKLDEALGPLVLDRAKELVDELEVVLIRQPAVAGANVERVREQRLVVGAKVELDRQRVRRVEAAAGHVERDLADRDAHAVGALVAEAENAPAIGHDDDVDVGHGHVVEDLPHAPLVRGRDEDALGPAPELAEADAGLADRRRVDDRQALDQVVRDKLVEERRRILLELAQPEVLGDRRRHLIELALAARQLQLDRLDRGGQQADERVRLAVERREGGATVADGVAEHVPAGVAEQRGGDEEEREHRARSADGADA